MDSSVADFAVFSAHVDQEVETAGVEAELEILPIFDGFELDFDSFDFVFVVGGD